MRLGLSLLCHGQLREHDLPAAGSQQMEDMMKVRAFHLRYIAAAFFLLFPANAVAQQAAEAGRPPFLYVLVADAGKIESNGDDYILKLNKDYIDHVMEISEKPFALKNYISADRIVATWKEGAGNFGGTTMKGTILSRAGAIRGINIKSITKTANEMQYVFSLDGDKSLDLGKYGILEEVTTVNYCCHPEGGGGEWLWGTD